jgi:hypothetical protein
MGIAVSPGAAHSAHRPTYLQIGFVDRRVQQGRVSPVAGGRIAPARQIIQPATSNSGFLA